MIPHLGNRVRANWERFQERWSPAFLLGLDPGIENATSKKLEASSFQRNDAGSC
jgi:hypothetical protein